MGSMAPKLAPPLKSGVSDAAVNLLLCRRGDKRHWRRHGCNCPAENKKRGSRQSLRKESMDSSDLKAASWLPFICLGGAPPKSFFQERREGGGASFSQRGLQGSPLKLGSQPSHREALCMMPSPVIEQAGVWSWPKARSGWRPSALDSLVESQSA